MTVAGLAVMTAVAAAPGGRLRTRYAAPFDLSNSGSQLATFPQFSDEDIKKANMLCRLPTTNTGNNKSNVQNQLCLITPTAITSRRQSKHLQGKGHLDGILGAPCLEGKLELAIWGLGEGTAERWAMVEFQSSARPGEAPTQVQLWSTWSQVPAQSLA